MLDILKTHRITERNAYNILRPTIAFGGYCTKLMLYRLF